VRAGDRVTKGQVVGRVGVSGGKPALGAPVHASIDGTVTAVQDAVVWIQKDGRP
jgi:Na+-translocating ferredoxin:NAD+ oxidoreductase RnfC subunit